MFKKGLEVLQQISRAVTGQTAVRPTIHDGLAVHILQAFGGQTNLSSIDACLTRLRVTVKNPDLVDKSALKQLGASGIWEAGDSFQAVFGTQSDTLKEQIKAIVCRGGNRNTAADTITAAEDHSPERIKVEHTVYAPLSGEIIDLAEVPDQVFAEKMMGDGFAIKPTDSLVLSPVKGKVLTAFSTKHAVGLVTTDGLEILIHVGIDTVKFRGEGFELLVKEGDAVEIGTSLLKFDLAYIETHAKSSMTPVVFTNLKEQIIEVNVTEGIAGQTMVCIIR